MNFLKKKKKNQGSHVVAIGFMPLFGQIWVLESDTTIDLETCNLSRSGNDLRFL